MKLYHGSNTIIEQIDLLKCKPYKDFGQGFYLTEIKEQAEQMAKRTSAIYGGEPVITVFEFDETALNTLLVKTFLFRNFDDGIIDLQMLVKGLRYKKFSSQYLFHSAEAIKYLRRI